jgi:hypothetical protein
LQRWKNELEQGSKRALEADSAETPPADDPSARSIRPMLRAGLSPLNRKLDLVPLMTSELNMLANQTSGLAALLHKMFEQITGRGSGNNRDDSPEPPRAHAPGASKQFLLRRSRV